MKNFTHGTNKRIILSPTLLIFALLLCTGLLVSCDKSIADYLDEKLIEQDFVLVHDAIVDGPDYSGAAYRLYSPKDRTVLQDGKTYVTATDTTFRVKTYHADFRISSAELQPLFDGAAVPESTFDPPAENAVIAYSNLRKGEYKLILHFSGSQQAEYTFTILATAEGNIEY